MSFNIKANGKPLTLLDNNDSGKFVLLGSDTKADQNFKFIFLNDNDLDTYDILLVNLGFTDSGYENRISGHCNFIPMSQFKSLPYGPDQIQASSIPFLTCEYYSWDFKDRYSVKLYRNGKDTIAIKTSYSSIKYYIYGVKF